jgi:hypothetical protein
MGETKIRFLNSVWRKFNGENRMLMFPSSIKNPIIIRGPAKQLSLARKGGGEAGLLRPGCEKGELKRGKR